MQSTLAKPSDKKLKATTPIAGGDLSEFKDSAEFEKQAAQFRYGKGGVRITYAELLDVHLCPINNVEFNQTVFVKIYFETAIEDEISCNYYVLDDKRNFILGAGLKLAGQPQMRVTIGAGIW